METVQLKKRAQDAGAQFSAFCATHEGKINLACNVGAYALGSAILAKSTTIAGIAAGIGLAVIGVVGITAQGIDYVVSKSVERRSAGDVQGQQAA